jgi:hypothetical protein
MRGLICWLANPTGRIARIVAGIVLVLVGLLALGGAGGIILALIGLVPLLAGLVDVCVFAPVGGLPFVGEALRETCR